MCGRIKYWRSFFHGFAVSCRLTHSLSCVPYTILLYYTLAYSFRDDSRKGGERSREGWEFKARDADDTDDNIRPWIGGFVQEHGNNKAKELLQGAGLDKSYKNPDEKAWTIMFLDEIMGVNVTKGNDIRVEFDNFVREMHHKKVAEE